MKRTMPAMSALDERLGVSPGARKLMRYVFPDHWSFMLGEVALYSFVVLVLTGILLRPALRSAAVMFVALGLGKYLQGEIATTANDFFFAFLICVGLFFLGLEPRSAAAQPKAA